MSHAHPTPILSLPPDSFSRALGELDPASRALLDLSLRRGMRPEEIGDLLGTDPESVIVARENALEQLASALGMEDTTEVDGVRARLAELPGDAWASAAPGEPSEEPEEAPARPALAIVPPAEQDAEKDEPAAQQTGTAAKTAEPTHPRPEPTRRSRLPLLLALLAVAGIALVVLLVSRGSGNDGSTSKNVAKQPGAKPAAPQRAASKPAPGAPSKGPKVALAPVAGTAGGASATASLADGGKRLLLNVKGLPDPGTGSYQVWLYDSVIDARSIGSARGRDLQMDLKLPASASNYRSVDVSLEPRDGNPNHSGLSVLRVPLAKLSR